MLQRGRLLEKKSRALVCYIRATAGKFQWHYRNSEEKLFNFMDHRAPISPENKGHKISNY